MSEQGSDMKKKNISEENVPQREREKKWGGRWQSGRQAG
jgi:hypothetical protein